MLLLQSERNNRLWTLDCEVGTGEQSDHTLTPRERLRLWWGRVASPRPSALAAGGTRSSISPRRSAPQPRTASLSIPAPLSPHRRCRVSALFCLGPNPTCWLIFAFCLPAEFPRTTPVCLNLGKKSQNVFSGLI